MYLVSCCTTVDVQFFNLKKCTRSIPSKSVYCTKLHSIKHRLWRSRLGLLMQNQKRYAPAGKPIWDIYGTHIDIYMGPIWAPHMGPLWVLQTGLIWVPYGHLIWDPYGSHTIIAIYRYIYIYIGPPYGFLQTGLVSCVFDIVPIWVPYQIPIWDQYQSRLQNPCTCQRLVACNNNHSQLRFL